LKITANDSVDLIGESSDGQISSGLFTDSYGSGGAGNLTIATRRLLVRDGAMVSVSTYGKGKGGSLKITADDLVEVAGEPADGQGFSSLFTQSGEEASGDAGDLTIDTRRLLVRDGAEVSASTYGEGKGGSLKITADDLVEVAGERSDGNSSLIAQSEGSRNAGNLTIDTGRLLVRDGAVVSSSSLGEGVAGDIKITARDSLQIDNGTISTNASRSAGGAIAIKAGNIRLFGNSDIRTDVASGAGGGGNITLMADSILAFSDSDILAFASDRGGNITLNTPAFFGENYRPAPRNTNPDSLTNNNQVDINATGAVSGIIIIPDVSFIQNSLIELPENQINTDSLLANSCIVRRNQPTRGSFTITGAGGLPQRPGDAQMSSFPTVDVATLPSERTQSNPHPHRAWQKGDPIIEPQGVYQLPNGKLVLSRECS
jgi:large exoprotein involved in heme utilization and adhesion